MNEREIYVIWREFWVNFDRVLLLNVFFGFYKYYNRVVIFLELVVKWDGYGYVFINSFEIFIVIGS